MAQIEKPLGDIARAEFLMRSLGVGASLLGSPLLLAACGDSTGPVPEKSSLLVALISGPVELRADAEDQVGGGADYSVIPSNPADSRGAKYDWTVRDKRTNEVVAKEQGPNLHYALRERGTRVIEVDMQAADGRMASTRYETQFLGHQQPYDLIAVVRSEPGASHGYLNFLDPESLDSIRQEVMLPHKNILPSAHPLVTVRSGITQALEGENYYLVMDRISNLVPDAVPGVTVYNKRLTWWSALGSSHENQFFPAWATNTIHLMTLATDRRLRDIGETEIEYFVPRYNPDPQPIDIDSAAYLAQNAGLADPHRDFFGKHSAIHPDAHTIAYGPTPFDIADKEVHRIAVYNMLNKTRQMFPSESALTDFLASHHPSVEPPSVRLGENGVTFSPDGETIAFNMYIEPTETDKLVLAGMSGGIRLFSDDGREPSFSPDGKRIGYLNSDKHLIIAPLDGNGPVRDATVESGGQGMHDTAFAWTG